MRFVQWAGFVLGGLNLLGFGGAIFDPSNAKDAAWYGSAAPVLLGIGALALVRRKMHAREPLLRGAAFVSVAVIAIAVAVAGNKVPGILAATYEGEKHVALTGDTSNEVYETTNAWLTSDAYKETTLTVALRWMDDDRYQPDLTATVQTADGEVQCASNDFRMWLRGTGQGEPDTEDLLCDLYISPSEFAQVGAVTLARKQ